jgi:ATP-dependent DNA ligase
MLATLVAQPFDRPGWVYEEKYDGDRILAYKEGAKVRLLSRNGKDRTDRFPGIAAAIRGLHSDTLLLDGTRPPGCFPVSVASAGLRQSPVRRVRLPLP